MKGIVILRCLFYYVHSLERLIGAHFQRCYATEKRIIFFKNTLKRVLFYNGVLLFLQRFFIGYWILKTGLDFYPGPFSFILS